MDTKWNNTTEAVEIEPVMPRKKRTGLRAAAAFLTFFMGVSLTLGSLCGAVGRRAIGSDYAEWWQNDWQETPVFRNHISNDLESFLAIGVGRTVDWYHPDYSVEDTVSGTGTIWFFADTPMASCETSFAEAQDTSPDSAYKHDLNTIYAIRAADGKKYSNLEEVTGYRMALDEYSKLPKGYNFLLIYEDGKVSIWKDGKKLSVYDSDNILDEDSLWNVPGYTNFKVGEEEAKVTIKMAVRQIPILYKGSNSYSYNSLYSEQPRGVEIACNFLLRGSRAACSMVRAEEGAVRGRSSHRQSDLPYLDGAALPCGVPVPALSDGSHAGGG